MRLLSSPSHTLQLYLQQLLGWQHNVSLQKSGSWTQLGGSQGSYVWHSISSKMLYQGVPGNTSLLTALGMSCNLVQKEQGEKDGTEKDLL